jgi:hypothetical protein
MKVYIAGPMTGLPDFNFPAFHAAAVKLRALGFEVENPAENAEPPCKSWLGYMRMAVAQVAKVDALVLLPGWEDSRGARVEFNLAVGLGLHVCTLARALGGWLKEAA